MDTLKTAFVVLLLLVVLYGVYVFLNKDVSPAPPEQGWAVNQALEPPQFQIGGPAGDEFSGDGPLVPGDQSAISPYEATGGAPSSDVEPTGHDHAGHDHGDHAGKSAGGASFAPTQPPPLPPSGFGAEEAGTAIAEPSPYGDSGAPQPVAPTQAYSSQYQGSNDSNPQPPTGLTDDTNSPPPPPSYTSPLTEPGQRAGGGESGSRYAAPPYGEVTGDRERSGYTPGTEQATAIIDPPAVPNNVTAPNSGAKNSPFADAREIGMRLAKAGKYQEALSTLSKVYGHPQVTTDEQRQLLDLLDPLAGKVVFSTEHLLERPHLVRRGETLASIANSYSVPVELLRNINGVQNPTALTFGETLKVVRGPFRAEVNLKRQELVLFLGTLYAGRFPISVGADPTPTAGEHTVKAKERGHAYYGGDGQTLPVGHPNNPYGQWWLDLGSDVSIHGSAAASGEQSTGCISLSPVDAGDVFGILSVGSRVTIRN